MRVASLFVALLVAGCVGERAPDPLPPVRTEAVADRVGCRDQNLGFVVDLERAQEALPHPFRARDLQALLETPAETGQGLVAIVFSQCEGSALAGGPSSGAALMVYVEPPLPHHQVPPRPHVGSDFLVLESVSDSSAERQGFASRGWNVTAGSSSSAGPLVPGTPAAATASDGTGVLYATTAAMPSLASRSETNHYWFTGGPGLVLVTATREDHDQFAGSNAVCTLRDGSAAARIVGADACRTGPTLAVLYPTGDLTGRIVHWPQAPATPGIP